MKRETLFNIIKNNTNLYRVETKLDSIEEKIPTFFDTDFKELVKNPILCKIVKKYITSSTELQEKYKDLLERIIAEVPSDPVIIGVTGTWGKTTVCNMLYRYLRNVGKHACLLSSSKVANPFLAHENSESNINSVYDNNYIKEFLKKSLISNPDYIIIEVHEHELVKKKDREYKLEPYAISNLSVNESVLDEIPFDYKILTNFCPDLFLEPWCTEEEMTEAMLDFIIPQDDEISFINTNTSIINQVYDSYKGNNVKYYGWPRHVAGDILKGNYNTTVDVNNLYGYFNSLSCDLISCKSKFTIDNVLYNVSLNNSIENAFNLFTVGCIIDYLNLFDNETFVNLAGISADIVLKVAGNKTIIITPENYIAKTRLYKFAAEDDFQNISFTKKSAEERIVCIQSARASLGWGSHTTVESLCYGQEHALPYKRKAWIDSRYCFYADKIIITPLNPYKLDPQEACDYDFIVYKSFLTDDEMPFELVTVPNRKQAIIDAVTNMEENDTLIISGRGPYNRYYCRADMMINDGKFLVNFTDEEIVRQTLAELGWEIIE